MTPDIFYKYRNDSERTEGIIINQKVWLSSPSQLNDPLECRTGEIPQDWKAKTIRKMEAGQIMGVVGGPPFFEPSQQLFSLSARETRQWLKRFKKLPHQRKIKAMRSLYSDHGIELSRPENIFKDMEDRLASVGIFSLSETCCNELMWAHYGSNHHGIAFGFTPSSASKMSNPRHFLQVTYATEKPIFKLGFKNELQIMPPGSNMPNVQRVSFEDDVFRSTLSTKTPAWEYEKEWRYVEESHGLFDYPGILSQAVFGLRMSEKRRKNYKQLVDKYIPNAVEFFEIVEARNLGGIDIRRI